MELNDPFKKSDAEILEEAARFKELLSEYRVVIKVPHTGPVNRKNVDELLTGDKRLSRRYNEVTTEDAFRGHNLALMLHEHGYRVNFTLMFEPAPVSYTHLYTCLRSGGEIMGRETIMEAVKEIYGAQKEGSL